VNHPLDGVRRKLKRATRKLDKLEAETTRWIATEPWEPFQESHPEGSVHFLRTRLREQPDPEWALEVGEAMGQARSALDHLVQQLVIANGKTPTGSHAFPIYKREEDFVTRKIAGIDPRWKTEIKSLQPYNARHALKNNPLLRLNALTQFDKHQDIHPVVVGAEPLVVGDQVRLDTSDDFTGGWIDMMMFPFVNEPVDGAVVAGAHFETFDSKARFHLDAPIRCRIAFSEAAITTTEMHDLVRIVRKILTRFKPAFE
jgi:hypothetical protein